MLDANDSAPINPVSEVYRASAPRLTGCSVLRQALGELEAAIGSYRNALHIDHSHAAVYHNMGAQNHTLQSLPWLTLSGNGAALFVDGGLWSRPNRCIPTCSCMLVAGAALNSLRHPEEVNQP